MMRKSVSASMEDMDTMTTDQKIDNLTTMVMELRNELLKFIKTKPATGTGTYLFRWGCRDQGCYIYQK